MIVLTENVIDIFTFSLYVNTKNSILKVSCPKT